MNQSPVLWERQMKRNKGNLLINSRSYLLVLAFLLLFLPAPAEAATISSVGGWNQIINSSNLTSGAGSDLTDTYLSSTGATTLEVSGCVDETEEWQIWLKRVDQTWDSDRFVLSVKRTSDGTGDGIISGGDTFQVVSTADVLFFTGQGDRSGITIQYRLTGISIQVLPDNYSAAVEFTIMP